MAVEVGEGFREVMDDEHVLLTDDRCWHREDSDISTWLQVSSTIPSAINYPTLGRYKSVMGAPNLHVRRKIEAAKNPSTSEQARGNQSILAEADQIAGESRSRDYGHPYDNHKRIADIWNVQIAHRLSSPIRPREVALLMIGLKLAREVNSQKRDNLIDAAGYVKCVDMIDQREAELQGDA